ncbi:hypothetical protein GJ496_010473 [Pomphorhynchus laevis]|nr:hypothetical protein GJ496_010473 [Pomphorhynchus laevis]
MSPPTFTEINSKINKLLNIGYYSNKVNLLVKTVSETGLKFEASGSNATDSNSTNAALSTKYMSPDGCKLTVL